MNVLTSPPEPVVGGGQVWPETGRTTRLLRRLAWSYAAGILAVAGFMASSAPMSAEIRASGLGGIAIAAMMLPFAGLCTTLPVMAARHGLDVAGVRHRLWAGRAGGERLALMARRPQGVIVPLLGLCVAVVAWWWRPGAAPGAHAIALGSIAIVLTFPLLVAERIMAGTPQSRLPEAPALQALAMVPVLLVPTAGLAQIVGGAWAWPVMNAAGLYIGLVAAELVLRGLANWFLPPPDPLEARGSVVSVAALLLQPRRIAGQGPAAILRTHLGLDFARSWTLRYVRAAAVPMLAVLGLVGWVLTGVSLIELDRRGIYERFGAPVAVWAPGAHVGLPWPLGRVQRVELGVVHALPLGSGSMGGGSMGGESGTELHTAAESPAPESADRLWDRIHPTEVSTLVASRDGSGAQGFQAVSVDMKVLYRTGLDDTAALQAAYRIETPERLVRAEAGRLLAQLFAGATLAAALAEDRATQADTLRMRLQAELDRLQTGLDVLGVIIETIHPPLAAAEAYHNVQAAEIVANTAIATERRRALASAAIARQNATALVAAAQATAAETVGQADVTLSGFAADQAAAMNGRTVFLLERYLANVASALAKSPLVIVDHRLGGADAPVIDLRSFGAPAGRPADDD